MKKLVIAVEKVLSVHLSICLKSQKIIFIAKVFKIHSITERSFFKKVETIT